MPKKFKKKFSVKSKKTNRSKILADVLSKAKSNQQQQEPVAKEEEKVNDEVKAHVVELEQLKKSQADFFEFLEREDADLLKFGQDEKDIEKDEAPPSTSPELVLTEELLDTWKVEAPKNLKSFKQLIKAFHVACTINNSNEDEQEKSGEDDFKFKYHILTSSIFNEVMTFSLKEMGSIFDAHLLREKDKEKDNKEKDETEQQEDREKKEAEAGKNQNILLPQKYPSRWAKISNMVKVYLKCILMFLKNLNEPKMILFVLKSTEKIIPYFGPFPRYVQVFVKKLLELWGTSDEAVRIMAFLNLRAIALNLPYPAINYCLKGIYLSYVRNSKFYNAKTTALINFMTNCVVELYGLDFVASYQHAFVYLRQLAVHLRVAYTTKSRENFESVYNWQTLQSMKIWVKVLCAYPNQEELWLLGHPIFQLLHGIITLLPVSRYYPLRLHCVRMMNELIQSRSQIKPVFGNSSTYLIEMLLGYPALALSQRLRPWKGKPEHFDYSLKVSDKYLGTKPFVDSILKEVHINLTMYLTCYARSVSFPELALPAITSIKLFLKTARQSPYTARFKTLVDALQLNSKFIIAQRNLTNIAPNDTQKIIQFSRQPLKQSTPLQQYNNNLLDQIKKEQQLFQDQEEKEKKQQQQKDKTDELEDDDDNGEGDDGEVNDVFDDDDVFDEGDDNDGKEGLKKMDHEQKNSEVRPTKKTDNLVTSGGRIEKKSRKDKKATAQLQQPQKNVTLAKKKDAKTTTTTAKTTTEKKVNKSLDTTTGGGGGRAGEDDDEITDFSLNYFTK